MKCDNCNTDFIPSTEQIKLIQSSREKGMSFVMLKCENCGLSFGYNPANLSQETFESTKEKPLRTPISGVIGFVSFIDSKNKGFYGCGETGAIWRTKESLYRDIEFIIQKYPHRQYCYQKTSNGWIANTNEPEEIELLIRKESFKPLERFERD